MKRVKSGVMVLLVLCVLLSYQNCAIVTSPKEMSTKSASLSSMGMTEAEQLSAKANAILMNKCQSCHNSTTLNGDFNVSDLNAMFYNRHIVPGEPLLSGLYEVVMDGSMPPAPQPGLSTQEIQDIYDWIQDGFKTLPDTSGGGGGNTTVMPTFASLSANVFQPKCMNCHGGANSFGGISFANYNSSRSTVVPGDPAGSVLYLSVTTATRRGGRMPQGAAALSNAEIAAIQSWIQQGAMNN